MTELKVQCDCGQKYKFDVEPVNGRMPFTVNCPLCGVDGTEKANALLQQNAPMPVAQQSAAPPPTHVAAPPPVPPGPPKLRIGLASHSSAPPPVAPPIGAVAPVDQAAAPKRFAPAAAKNASGDKAETNYVLGIVGAVVGGFIGMMGWYFLIKWTDHTIGYAAWGVGVIAGFGARILGREGSTSLGVVAGICALVAILGGQYLFVSTMFSSVQDEMGKMMEQVGGAVYETRMEFAKQAENARTEAEIKALYEKMNFAPATERQLAEFKEKTLPELKDLASGKISKEDFLKKLKQETNEAAEEFDLPSRFSVFKETIDAFTLLFLALGVSSAYKIGAG